jgi:hypothetical protein
MPKRLKTAGRGGCGEEAESPQREGCGQHPPGNNQGEQQVQRQCDQCQPALDAGNDP